MEHIRVASVDEVKEIQATSDITPRSTVFKLGNLTTVVRNVFEVDPLYTNGSGVGPLSKFIWGLEERLIGSGVDAYYFSINADDDSKEWRALAQKWGAEELDPNPRLRYKRVLIRNN